MIHLPCLLVYHAVRIWGGIQKIRRLSYVEIFGVALLFIMAARADSPPKGGFGLYEISYIISNTVLTIIVVMQVLLLVRALVSWLPIDQESKVCTFLYAATEPVIVPVRLILDRFESIQRLPVDLSVLATMIILSVLTTLLPRV